MSNKRRLFRSSSRIRIDERNFLWVNGAKSGFKFFPEKGVLQFVDKDRRRAAERGARVVEIFITELMEAQRMSE